MRSETVAVIVVTFNRADLLGRTLDGLAGQTHQPDAVIVIERNSGTTAAAQEEVSYIS